MLIKRESNTGSNDLHTVYRPYRIDELLGNEINKNIIKNSLSKGTLSHSLLFIGDPGCGKTTVARIVALGLNCEKNGVTDNPCLECEACKSILNFNSIDVKEINAGASGNKGDTLDVTKDLASAPFNSRFKVLIFDEAHALNAYSQKALLKIIEDGYKHVYFIFCTNEPQKLRTDFIQRCNTLTFDHVSEDIIQKMLVNVCEFEGVEYKNDVLKIISEETYGVPREALVLLKRVIDEGSWDVKTAGLLAGLVGSDDPQILSLFNSLNARDWKLSMSIYKQLSNIPPETIRISLAGLFTAALKRTVNKNVGDRYSKLLDSFVVPIFDSGKLGEHKLINMMYKAILY